MNRSYFCFSLEVVLECQYFPYSDTIMCLTVLVKILNENLAFPSVRTLILDMTTKCQNPDLNLTF